MAEVVLKDGRMLPVSFVVDAPRPALELLNRSIRNDPQAGMPLVLGNAGDMPLNARVTLALKSTFPARFSRTEKVEVALTDGSLRAMLTIADGSLVLQDAQTALAFLSPGKAFGTSAFGPLQMRAVLEDGTVGDWMPLGTLVRTPAISSFTCVRGPHLPGPALTAGEPTAGAETGCTLSGTNLFLIESVSADSRYTAPVALPAGFAGDTFAVRPPSDNRTLYMRLRDDPATVVTLILSPVQSSVTGKRSQPASFPPPVE